MSKRSSQRSKIFSLLFLLAAYPPAAHADCRIQSQAIMAVTYDGFLPTVTVRINGQKFLMGIDTGAQGTLLTPQAVLALHLPYDHHYSRKRKSRKAGLIKRVKITTFDFAGVRYEDVHLPVIPLPLGNIPGQKLAGLIGANLLSHYDIDYNPSMHRIALYNVEGCAGLKPAWEKGYTALAALITASHRFVVPLKLDGYPVTAVFDTGSSGLRLSTSSLKAVGLSKKDLKFDVPTVVRSAASVRLARLHQFHQIQIGQEIFPRPQIQVLKIPAKEADMLLGENYMRRRRFWISYATRTLFIQLSKGDTFKVSP